MAQRMNPFVPVALVALLAWAPLCAESHGGGRFPTPRGAPPGAAPASTFEAPAPVGRPRTATSFEDWYFWWHHNTDRLEAKVARDARISPDGKDAALFARILETLRESVAYHPQVHQAIRANAIRALARITNAPADVERIIGVLEDDASGMWLEREAAALGLGLLRRSDAALRLPPACYVRARDALLTAFEDTKAPSRTRAFAMLAVGLLGDQPFGEGEASAASITARIESLLRGKYQSQDLVIALLMALRHQPRDTISSTVLDLLRDAVLDGRLAKGSVPDAVRSQAALTLGRLGTAEDVAVFEKVLRARGGMPRNTQRGSAIALGTLGARLPLNERKRVAGTLLRLADKQKDPSTRHGLTMALVPLMLAGTETEQAALVRETRADEHLLELALDGKYIDRPYGALALGLILRALSDAKTEKALTEFRRRGIKALQRAFSRPKGGAVERAADGLALAIVNDPVSTPILREVAADLRRSDLVRDYTLLGLALQPPRQAGRGATHRLARRMADPGYPVLVLRTMGLTAPQATASVVPFLAQGLIRTKSQSQKGEAAVALARVGNAEAVENLLRIVADENAQDLTRAMAVVGLGRVADPEPVPSHIRLIEGMNHRSQTDLTNELLSVY